MSTNYQGQGQGSSDNGQQTGKGYRKRRSLRDTFRERKGTAVKEMLIDIVAGAAGAAVGAMIGRPSLLLGAGVNYLGHALDTKAVSTFGTGMAIVNAIQGNPLLQLNGTEEKSKWELAKERLSAYKDGLLHKLYLDKVFKKDEPKAADGTTTDTKTVGEVKHFIYPYDSIIPDNQRVEIPQSVQGSGDLDFSALDVIENKLADSANAYQQKSGVPPIAQSINGYLGELVEDPLY